MKTGYVITKEIFTGEYSAPEVKYICFYVGNDIKSYLKSLSGHEVDDKPWRDASYCTGVAYDYYYYAYKTKIIED
jgi:hypothetical protein